MNRYRFIPNLPDISPLVYVFFTLWLMSLDVPKSDYQILVVINLMVMISSTVTLDICLSRFNLIKAAQWGHKKTIKSLIRQGVDVNHTRDIWGYTALHHAIALGHKEVVEILLDAGSDITIKNIDNNSPMFIARRQYNRSFRVLLSQHRSRLNSLRYILTAHQERNLMFVSARHMGKIMKGFVPLTYQNNSYTPESSNHLNLSMPKKSIDFTPEYLEILCQENNPILINDKKLILSRSIEPYNAHKKRELAVKSGFISFLCDSTGQQLHKDVCKIVSEYIDFNDLKRYERSLGKKIISQEDKKQEDRKNNL